MLQSIYWPAQATRESRRHSASTAILGRRLPLLPLLPHRAPLRSVRPATHASNSYRHRNTTPLHGCQPFQNC